MEAMGITWITLIAASRSGTIPKRISLVKSASPPSPLADAGPLLLEVRPLLAVAGLLMAVAGLLLAACPGPTAHLADRGRAWSSLWRHHTGRPW